VAQCAVRVTERYILFTGEHDGGVGSAVLGDLLFPGHRYIIIIIMVFNITIIVVIVIIFLVSVSSIVLFFLLKLAHVPLHLPHEGVDGGVVGRAGGHQVPRVTPPYQTRYRIRQIGVEVAVVEHGDSYGIYLYAPLAGVRVLPQVVQQELPADVPEPRVVSLEGGALQAGLPDGGVPAVCVAHRTVVVVVCYAGFEGSQR